MSIRKTVLLVVVAACLAMLVPRALTAQAVEGAVVTTEGAQPIPGVTVALFDTLYSRHASTVTDARGRFRIEAPGPGAYFLLLEGEGLASEISPPLVLDAGETVSHRMAVQGRSVEQMAALSRLRAEREALADAVLRDCGAEAEGGEGAVLAGFVRDAASDIPLPGVGVVLEWEEDGEPRSMEVRTGRDGGYMACGAPAGVPVMLSVRDLGSGDGLAELTLDEGVVHLLDLPVDVATFGAVDSAGVRENARLVGRVVEHGTVRPVEGATIRLGEDGPMAVSGPSGYFHLDEVEPGSYVLRVEHLGYGAQERVVQARPGRMLRVDVALAAEAIELEGIEVSVESRAFTARMAGFYDRMELGEARGTGDFIVREEIELRGGVPISALLRGRRGIQVRRTRSGYIPVFRRAWRPSRGDCRPVLYLDGHRIGTSYVDVDIVPSFEIEAIEVYRGAAEMPGEFADSDSQCGVIAVWTR